MTGQEILHWFYAATPYLSL